MHLARLCERYLHYSIFVLKWAMSERESREDRQLVGAHRCISDIPVLHPIVLGAVFQSTGE